MKFAQILSTYSEAETILSLNFTSLSRLLVNFTRLDVAVINKMIAAMKTNKTHQGSTCIHSPSFIQIR